MKRMMRGPRRMPNSGLAIFRTTLSVILTLLFLASSLPAQKPRIAGPAKSKSSKTTKASNATKNSAPRRVVQDATGETVGVPWTGEKGIARTTSEIMQAQLTAPVSSRPPLKPEHENEERRERPQDPNARAVASYPESEAPAIGNVSDGITPQAPQTLGTNVDTVTGPAETGAFPPDTMGAVGPSQVVVFLNGRLRTFNKTTGAADGVINVDSDVFFASVMTTPPPGGINFTSDPQVRYDRLTSRWILIIIDIPSSSPAAANIGDIPNRILIAVSDAASNGVISGGTVWTFYFVQQDTVGGPSTDEFLDYPSLGVDNNALYVGGNMFGTPPAARLNTSLFVIRKSSILSGGPVVTTAFRNLVGADGPFDPRGVDNYSTTANEGYIIGVSAAAFGRLIMRRIATPGGTPTISANVSITVSATSFPIPMDHLGNTIVADGNGDGFADGALDTIDDRLFAAHIRNGRLWTAHNIAVTAAGVGSNANAQRRNGVRWYELNVPVTVGTPTITQSGTIFDTAATRAAARQFSFPTVTVSGQGHAAFGYSTAGAPFRVDAATNGRLAADTLGTSGAVALYTASSTAYNPPGDPGPNRRWGDYSFTSLDPKDDMTMWTIQEYCNGTNTYNTRLVKLIAPGPPTPLTPAPAAIQLNNPSTNIVVTGSTALPAGRGFYDPGADPAAPHTTFTHISGSGPGIIVNSVTFNSPGQVTVNVSTVGSTPGAKTITITNPDGQSSTFQVIVGPTASTGSVSGIIATAGGGPVPGVVMTLAGALNRSTVTDSNGAYRFTGIGTENLYSLTPSLANFHFNPEQRSFSLVGNKTDAVFNAIPDSVTASNAIDTSEYFVRQQYLDFLGREPDQGGFDYWSAQLNQCGGERNCLHARRIDLSAAFFTAEEFQRTGSFIYRLYKGALGRQLHYAEYAADRGQVLEGPNLEATKTAFTSAFVQRQEFLDRYQNQTTASSFVDAALATVSVAGVDLSSLRAELITKYNSGSSLNESRALVVRELAENPAFAQTVYNRVFVLMEYFGYLRRDPDAGGYNFWLNVLDNREPNNYRGMVCSFVTSAEYQRRFSSVVTRTNADCGR